MKNINRLFALLLLSLSLSVEARIWPWKPSAPSCDGVKNWATQLTLSSMVEHQLINDSTGVDLSKLKTTLLESVKVGKFQYEAGEDGVDVYRQIQKVAIITHDGREFEVLTISEVTQAECSMSPPRILLLAPEFKVLDEGTSILEVKASGQ